jgi:four helix bundle protein
MQDFRDLKVWHKAHAVTLSVHRATRVFPREEIYGLTSQIRRCGVSVSANIAEGCGRDSNAELARFCEIAMSSASELEYHLLLAHDLDYLTQPDYVQLSAAAVEVKRMLAPLIRSLRPRRARPSDKLTPDKLTYS